MLRRWLIEVLGGYADLDSAIESMRKEENSEERRRVLTLAVKRLYATIGPEDIIQIITSGHWLLAGKPLTEGQIKALRDEANLIQGLSIWKVLQTEVKYHATKKMFIESRTLMDLEGGKLLLYFLDIMNTRLKKMSS